MRVDERRTCVESTARARMKIRNMEMQNQKQHPPFRDPADTGAARPRSAVRPAAAPRAARPRPTVRRSTTRTATVECAALH